MVQKSYRLAPSFAASLIISFASTGAFADLQNSVTTVKVSEGVSDWVVHESTGRVFASLEGGAEVVEFNLNGKEVRRLAVGANPGEMIIKRDTLIVACPKPPALHIFDLSTNDKVGEVSVHGEGPYALFCSQVDNKFAYCICSSGSAWRDGEIFQIDLAKAQVRKTIKVQGWGQSHPVHVAMSRDGNWIVPDARGASSPSGADLMKVDENELTFTQVRDYHSSFGQMVAGPMNRYWTFGNVLYSLDITKEVRAFAGSPVAIHPALDLAVSLKENNVVFERFSDATAIDGITLEPVTSGSPRDPRQRSLPRFETDPTVQFGLADQFVFIGQHNRGDWIQFASLSDRLLPLRIVQAPSNVTVTLGQELRVPLKITNDSPDMTLNAVSSALGVKVSKDHLTWKPGAENVGYSTIELTLGHSNGQTLDSTSIQVHVVLPKIDIGFYGKAMKLSANENFLLVWGIAPGEERRHPAHTGPDSVAVIDLTTWETLGRKTFPEGIRCATIDDKYVYLAPGSGDLFRRYDHTLSEEERQFLTSTPTNLIKLSPQTLVSIGSQQQFFDVEEMKAIPALSEPVRQVSSQQVQLGKRIIHRQSQKLLRLASPLDLPLLASEAALVNTGSRTQSDGFRERWGRKIEGNTLISDQGVQITQWGGSRQGLLLETSPAAILVSTANQGRVFQRTMELRNLVDGTVAYSALIDESTSQPQWSINFYDSQDRMIQRDQQLLYLGDQEVLIAAIPESVTSRLPVPAHFTDQQPTEINVGGMQDVPLRAGGDLEGATYTLMLEYPGLVLDKMTGVVSVDTDRLWRELSSSPVGESKPTPGPPTPPVSNARRYQELTGKELPEDMFAACLPVSASLKDAEGIEDRIDFSVIVVGPRKPVEAAIARKQLEREQQLAAIREQQAEARARALKMRNEGTEGEQDIDHRLNDLENRIRRIEAALDPILKKLEDEKR